MNQTDFNSLRTAGELLVNILCAENSVFYPENLFASERMFQSFAHCGGIIAGMTYFYGIRFFRLELYEFQWLFRLCNRDQRI